MTGLLESYNWGTKDLTLKQQADLVSEFLDMIYGMLWQSFPDLQLTRSGWVANGLTIQVDTPIVKELLSKKDWEEYVKKCSGCGQPHPKMIQDWIIEGLKRKKQTTKVTSCSLQSSSKYDNLEDSRS